MKAIGSSIDGSKTEPANAKNESVDLSVIVPVTERCEDLAEIIEETAEAIRSLSLSYEFIVVFDGKFALECEMLMLRRPGGLRTIRFNGNFGESSALKAGFEAARGRWIATLASYPQVAAREFEKSYNALMAGADMVVTRREPRVDAVVNRVQTFVFHKIVGWLTGHRFRDMACGLKMFPRAVAEELDLYGDLHRFLPSLAVQRGFSVVEVPVAQDPRNGTMRVYGPATYLHRLLELLNLFFLTKFAKRPLRLFGGIGLLLMVAGAGVTSLLTLQRLWGLTGLADRPLFLLGIALLFLGVQVMLLGLVGEIIVFAHAREIKDYRIDRIHN